MPITKSAKKRLRQSLKARRRNLRRQRKIKSLRKEIQKLIKAKKIKQAQELLPEFYKACDKAAKTFWHKKKAARVKSRMTSFVNKTAQGLKTQKLKKKNTKGSK